MAMRKQGTTPTNDGWRNRIVGEGMVAAAELVPHPQNWRKHPQEQGAVLTQTLDGVGWVQRVIVNRRTGRMLDGHLRARTWGGGVGRWRFHRRMWRWRWSGGRRIRGGRRCCWAMNEWAMD